MPQGMTVWLALVFVLACVGTWLALRYASARRLLDQPGERRSHGVATPRGGGIAIVAAMLVALIATMVWVPDWAHILRPGIIGFVLVALIGWVDDHRPLSPWRRLGVHAIAAVLLALSCLAAGGTPWQALLAFTLAMVLVNVWNFMDGINGIAASQAALVAMVCGLCVASGDVTRWLAWALLAACLGFLPFNFPRARIFMGDVGSGALGYALAMLIVLGGGISPTRAGMLMPLSAFLVDATLTLATRMVRGEPWWTPHVQHLYQGLARRWGSHARVTLAYAAWTVAAALVLWWVRLRSPAFILCAVCGWYLLGAGTWFLLRREINRE